MDKVKELAHKYRTLLGKHGINTPLRLAHFFGQLEHESGLKPVEENLNYSAQGLADTWPTRYAKDPKSKTKEPNVLALSLHRKPEDIANHTYANRMGNGSVESGEGWKYRGRGFIQVTGRDNYEALSKDTGVDCLNNPDLLLGEVGAMVAAVWYWDTNNLNALADKDDIVGVTKRINGGTIGLEHRTQLTNKYKKIWQ